MSSIVITGCFGFIGKNFLKKCLKLGHYVYGIDNLSYSALNEYDSEIMQNENFKFVKEDISKLEYLPDCDYIVNFAAESHVDNSIANSEKFLDTNVKGTTRLLDLVKQKSNYKMPLFVQISTDEVYGDNKTHKYFTEEQILNPSNPYAASKASADLIVLSYARTHNISYVIFRPTNNYGVGQHPEKFIPKSIQLLMRKQKIQIHGDGSFERCWLHVEDTCDAIYNFLKIDFINNKYRNQIYNISSDEFISIEKIAYDVVKHYYLTGFVDPLKFIEYNYERKGADINYRIDSTKLRYVVDWKPYRKFTEEIDKIINDVKLNFRW